MMLKVMKTKLKKKAMRKKRKREDYGLRKSRNTSEEMMLLPHKLTQPKVLKKTLKQKVTTVKMMVKMTKKEMMKKEMTTKRKRKKEDYGSKRLPNTLEEMMLMPHKLTQPKVLKKTLKQKVTTEKMMVEMTKKEMTTKRKRKREDYGLIKSLNTSEEMMLMP